MSDSKSTSPNAVSTFRWERLKREYSSRTRRDEAAGANRDTAPTARVADPNAE